MFRSKTSETDRKLSWPDPAEGFRTDIEGLRGLSVLLVVLFHIEIDAFSGGFIGVDVFFVISGYLLTSLFFGEIKEKNQVNVSAFFSRRVRRLLPASVTTILATILLAWILLSPFGIEEVIKDAFGASTYSMNFVLLQQSTDYLSAQSSPSVFQHYWSLAVEEQFYFLWPFVFAGIAKLRISRERCGVPMVIIIAASLWLSIEVSENNESWAFFMLPTRAWEMAFGALLACYRNRILQLGQKFIEVLAIIGLSAILISSFIYDDFTLYPSWRAIFPVVGSGFIIVSAGSAVSRALSSGSLVFLGKYSYGWYLWHWPFICLANRYFNENNRIVVNAMASIIALAVAIFSHKLIESPVRKFGFFIKRPSRGVLFGILLTLLSVILVFTAFQLRPKSGIQLSSNQAQTPIIITPQDEKMNDTELKENPPENINGIDDLQKIPDPKVSENINGIDDLQKIPDPKVPDDSFLEEETIDTALQNHYEVLESGARTQKLPDSAGLGGPDPRIYDKDLRCHLGEGAQTSPPCVYGNPDAERTMVLYGDSHAASWFPLFNYVAEEFGWRLLSRTKSSCFVEHLEFPLYGVDRKYSECFNWKQWVQNELGENQVDLIIMATKRKDAPIINEYFSSEEWAEGLTQSLNNLNSVVPQVVLMGATPYMDNHVRECVTANEDIAKCHGTFGKVVPTDYQKIEETATSNANVTYIPIIDLVCTDTVCPSIVGNNVTFRDRQHLTRDFVLTLTNFVVQRLLEAGIDFR